MGCRHNKRMLMLALFLVLSASAVVYFGNRNDNQTILYHPREVKIQGVHLADT